MSPRAPGYSDRPLSAEQLRDALAAALGIDPSGLALLSAREASLALARLRGLHDRLGTLEERASIDELTGVLRRGAGLDAVTREIDRARRTGAGLVAAFVDVDGLKAVNDRLGHAAGDRLLTQVAGVLRASVRSYDVVVRYGGDEFVFTLFGAELEGAERRLTAVATGIAAATGGRTVSWGLVTLTPEDTAESLIARADAALYRGRRQAGPPPDHGEGTTPTDGTADRDTAGAP